MRKALHVSIFALAIGLTGQALAAEPGWYGELKAGPTVLENMTSSNGGSNLALDPKTGWAIEGGAGFRMESGLRLGLEGGYQRNRLRGSFSQTATGACGSAAVPCLTGDVRGHIAAPSLFAMAHYDVPITDRLSLGLGAGVGAQRIDLNAYTTGVSGGLGNRFTLIDAEDTVFAWRGGAELAYNRGTRTDLTVGYKYTHSAKPTMAGRGAYTPFTFSDNMATHAFTAGVRLAF